MNQTTFIGNIGKEAEIRNVNNVFAIGFNLAVNENYKDQEGNKVEKTLWVSCTIWKDKSAQTKIAEYLKKGTKVLVQGEIQPDVFKNKDGIYMPQLRLRVQRLELLSPKPETLETTETEKTESAKPEKKKVAAVSAGSADEGGDDLPF